MFECSACTARCLRAIGGDAFAAGRAYRWLLLAPRRNLSVDRQASTAAAVTNGSTGREPYLNTAQIRYHNAHTRDENTTAIDKAAEKRTRVALEKELQWLKDPLKFSDHVQYTLRCDKPDKALELCRLASKSMGCVVAWNRIVDWYMQRGQVNQALKVYNEMKKRAQFPDSYTYIFLLRGLAPQTVADRTGSTRDANAIKAATIYNGMSAPTSRVKPAITHTNAALKVCTFASNLDAFWGIVGHIPDTGAGAADQMTYKLILDAIRHEVKMDSTDLSRREIGVKKLRAANQGRKIWQDIIAKWRAGQVRIDEPLVCAMARVLLTSERIEDWDAVLDLVWQTMQIERMTPPLGSEDRHTEHVPKITGGGEVEKTELSAADRAAYENRQDTPASKTFNAVQPFPPDKDKPLRPTNLAYVAPGNDTLSVLIEACTLMRMPKAAWAYWELLTREYGIKPDVLNMHAQLRLLHKNRASAKAAKVVTEDLPRSGIEPRKMTFRLALDVCVRDKLNPNSLSHARTIVDKMEETLADLDPRTLISYLNLAIHTNNGPKIVAALNRLDTCVHNLRSRFLYGSEPSERVSDREYQQDRLDTLQLLQLMVGAIDRLRHGGLVPREDLLGWHKRRSQLTRFIGRGQDRMDKVLERKSAEADNETAIGEKLTSRVRRDGTDRPHQTYTGPSRRKPVMSSKAFWGSLRQRRDAGRKSKRTRKETVPAERSSESKTTGIEPMSGGYGKDRVGVEDVNGFADLPGELTIR